MAMTDWTIIRRSMGARLFSTVTTVVTVAVAVALMLVLLSMRDAGQRAFERGGGNMHILMSRDADPLTAILNNVFYARPPRNWILWHEYERLAAKWPFEFAIPTQQGDSYRGYPVLATTPEFFTKFEAVPGRPWRAAEGRVFSEDFEATLGAEAARSTGLRIGDKIVLTHGTPDSRAADAHVHDEYAFTVVGTLEPTGTSHDRAVFTSLRSAWIIHAHDRIEADRAKEGSGSGEHAHGPLVTEKDLTPEDKKLTGIYLRVAGRGGASSALLPQAFEALRREPTFVAANPAQEIGNLFRIIGNINQVLVGMAAVVMVSSGIAIMLALYNSMEQRRRQIAVLRVLGCSRPRVFGLVVTESAVLGLVGAAAGVLLAMAGAWVVAWIMRQRLGLVIDPGLTLVWVLAVAMGTVALAAVAGLVPAVMAYRTSVARNLRPLG
ncbi:MAG: ABC transporter permease [Phycisphaerales bacterium]